MTGWIKLTIPDDHLLDTSALLAHYLAEPGAERVQALFEDEAASPGTSILALFEFELRLRQLGMMRKPASENWPAIAHCWRKSWT